MKTAYAIALFVAAVIVSIPSQASKGPPPLSTVPLASCSEMPCVEVTVLGGRKVRLLIDTGNATSALDVAVAKSLGLSLEPVLGADGKPIAGYSKSHLPGVKIGGLVLGDVRVAVVDLSADIKAGTSPQADGSLAYSAFKDRILQLDYATGQVGISPPLTEKSGCTAAFCSSISLITFGQHGPPIVVATGFTVNGKSVTAQIDTLFSETFLVYPTSVDKLGLQVPSKSEKTKHVPFTDGGVDLVQASASAEGFGKQTLMQDTPLFFAGPKVHLPDGLFDATVGLGLLKTHKATFNFHDQLFSLE